MMRTTFAQALARHAMQPFVPQHWHWAAVLLLQRLLTVLAAALSTTAVEASVGIALVSMSFLLVQLISRPYKLVSVNGVQTTAAVSLLTLAILNSASGAFRSTGFDPNTDGNQTLRRFEWGLELCMLLTLLPPPLVLVYHLRAVCRS